MTEEKLVPELRFPEFSGNYNKSIVRDEFEFIKKYSYSRNDEGKGIYHHIHYGDIHSRYNGYIDEHIEVPSIINTNEHEELKNGDIIIADASEDYKDLGKALILLSKGKRKVIAGLHTFALRSKSNLDPRYFLYYTKTDEYKEYMSRIGTGTSVFGISKNNLEIMSLLLPSTKEQEKIGSFFYKIDKKLKLQKEKIEEVKNYKKAMMQRIFDQEIRFKDENGESYPDWEEKKLEDIGNLLTSSVNKKINSNEIIVNLYNYMDVYNKVFINKTHLNKLDKTSATSQQIKNNSLLKGDILITPSSETSEDIGHSMVIWGDLPNTVYSYHLLRFRPNIKMDLSFSNYWFNNGNTRKEFIIRSQGATRFTISIKNLNEIKIKYPILKEQEKIGRFLSSIDNKIELEKEKIEKYEKLKKGLMQRMFI